MRPLSTDDYEKGTWGLMNILRHLEMIEEKFRSSTFSIKIKLKPKS